MVVEQKQKLFRNHPSNIGISNIDGNNGQHSKTFRATLDNMNGNIGKLATSDHSEASIPKDSTC